MTQNIDLKGNTLLVDGVTSSGSTSFAGLTLSTSAGAPTASAAKGSLAVDVTNAQLYINTTGSTTWAQIAHA